MSALRAVFKRIGTVTRRAVTSPLTVSTSTHLDKPTPTPGRHVLSRQVKPAIVRTGFVTPTRPPTPKVSPAPRTAKPNPVRYYPLQIKNNAKMNRAKISQQTPTVTGNGQPKAQPVNVNVTTGTTGAPSGGNAGKGLPVAAGLGAIALLFLGS